VTANELLFRDQEDGDVTTYLIAGFSEDAVYWCDAEDRILILSPFIIQLTWITCDGVFGLSAWFSST
jgi:hypothetical protein